jgi:hypothetical protein
MSAGVKDSITLVFKGSSNQFRVSKYIFKASGSTPSSSSTTPSSSSQGSSSSNSISVICDVNNLEPSYVSGSSVPRPNINCSAGEPGTAKFSISNSDSEITGWNSPDGTHLFYNTGTRTVFLSNVECSGTEITLNPTISCGSFEIVESTTPVANHSPLATSHSPIYYTLKGEPLGNAKPQKAGIYIVKQGNSIQKIAVR